jgi:hypothetical protein
VPSQLSLIIKILGGYCRGYVNGIPQSSALRVSQDGPAGLSLAKCGLPRPLAPSRTRPASTSSTFGPLPALVTKARTKGGWTHSTHLPRWDAHAYTPPSTRGRQPLLPSGPRVECHFGQHPADRQHNTRPWQRHPHGSAPPKSRKA